MQYQKLTDTQKYVRDPFSKALISADTVGLNAYRNVRRQSEQLIGLESELNTIRREFSELQKIVSTLLHPHTPA